MEEVDVRGKRRMDSGVEADEDKDFDIETLLSDLYCDNGNGGFTLPTAVPTATGGSGGYGGIGRASFYLDRCAENSLISVGPPSMGAATSGMASPVVERDPSMEESRLIQRLGDIHFGNDPSAPVTARIGLKSPVGSSSYAVGEWSTGVSVPRHSHGLSNLSHRLVSTNHPIASSSLPSSSSLYFGIDSGGEVYDDNSFPAVNGNSQRYGIRSDWANTYLPNSTLAMPRRVLNSAIAVADQGHRLPEELNDAAVTNGFEGVDGFSRPMNDAPFFGSRGGRSSMRARVNVDRLLFPIRPCCPMHRNRRNASLTNLKGEIYAAAMHQHGCRFLQDKLQQGRPEDVEMIFLELVGNFPELMVDPFGNYLMQRLFDVCTEQQRQRIIIELIQLHFQLVRICMDTHGTRAAQKLIETLHTQEQIDMLVKALRPGSLILILDANGHHVILRCLQCLNPEDNEFIFEAGATYCIRIATDQHGCRAIQHCIACSTGEYKLRMIMQIAARGLNLAYDPYGNYVVQFVMDMKDPMVNKCLMDTFKGNYVNLSMNKFASNVVEKCLQLWEPARKTIILEFLATPIDILLQDRYANYVIQDALSFKGFLHDMLIEAIKPHAPALRTNPYCKKIFSKSCFKRCKP